MSDLLTELGRRIRNSLAFGVTKAAPTIGDDGVPTVQVQLGSIETANLRVVEMHGFASDLPVGTPVQAHFCAGDRANGVVHGSTSPSSRPVLTGTDDKAIYGHGWTIIIAADGVHITAPLVTITGNLQVMGEVTAKTGTSGSVTLSEHKGHTTGGTAAPTQGT